MGWQPDTQPKGKPPVEKTKGAETMQRLIDADALKESIDEHVYLVNHGFNETEYGCTQYGIHQIIDDAPTIDAIPIEWIMRYAFDGKRKHPISITEMIADWRKEHDQTD